MTSRPQRLQRWVAAHCEQSRGDSCVPACVAMVRGLVLGLEADEIPAEETTCIALWGSDGRGIVLGQVRDLGFGHRWDIDFDAAPDAAVADLEDRLQDGPLIVGVWIGPLRHAQGGSGWQPSDRLLHAIVLVGHERRRFVYLDPAHPRSRQPFTLTYAQLLDAWTGELAYLPPMAP
mgnify:CR=1 FL=1